ncbi:MAG: class I SAM-dependent methyltransferase [Cyanobacteria bacterium P01_F01_bin.3]
MSESPSGVSDWFEPLYAEAAGNVEQVPWALADPAPYLTHWLRENKIEGLGQSAVVVGCGLGNDAEALAAAGFTVTAFDVSGSAIAWAKKRFPNTSVNYVTADLFQLPSEWQSAFELVFEFRTIQSLPLSVRASSIESIAAIAKPGGTVLVATYLRPDSVKDPDGPPWPLSMGELRHFETIGLEVVKQNIFQKKNSRFSCRVHIQYRRPQPSP